MDESFIPKRVIGRQIVFDTPAPNDTVNTMPTTLTLKKAHWLVTIKHPYVTLEDVTGIIESLAENEDIKLSEWKARELADFCIDILKDL